MPSHPAHSVRSPPEDAASAPALNARGFGISNGVITILALIAGFVATSTPKVGVVGALLSLLITDPLGDSYSIYIAMRDRDEDEARHTFRWTWLYQVLVQTLFLVVVLSAPSLPIALGIACVLGTGLIFYDLIQRLPSATLVLREYAAMVAIVVFTFAVDSAAVHVMGKGAK